MKGSHMSEKLEFVQENEKAIADLKNGYLNNVLSGEGILKENAVVTNKRLYYDNRRGLLWRVEERDRINIEDITAVKIAKATSLYFLAVGIAVALALFFLKEKYYQVLAPLAVILGVILDIILSKNYLSIEYAGGHIRFSVKQYKMEHIVRFQEAIFRVKDHVKTKALQSVPANDVVSERQSTNVQGENTVMPAPKKNLPQKPSSMTEDSDYFEE